MKIKTKLVDFEKISNLKINNSIKPLKPMWLLGALIYILSIPELWAVKFRLKKNKDG